MAPRVRFAPSPTGFLHIGGVRTALFNWLFARHEGGEFLLRIENTDRSREVEESVGQIQASLEWLGLDWDSAVAFQLDRLERHQEAARQLVESGHAYEDDGAIRFRMPDEGQTGWDDVVRGRIDVPNEKLEDVVLLRPDGRKLSKRHGAVSVEEFRARGYLPEALVNYLALLGWSLDAETTVIPPEELVRHFTLDRVGASPATFDYQKLEWLNGVYLRELPPAEYADRLVAYLREAGFPGDEATIRAAAPLVQEKIATLGEFPAFAGFLFAPVEPDPEQLDGAAPVLEEAARALAEAEPLDPEHVEEALRGMAERLELKPRQAFAPVRLAVTGSKVSPGLFESIALLGREETLRRLAATVASRPA
jgi:glutamyl-tRNA synthetase